MALPKFESLLTVSGGSGSSGAWRCVLTETGGGGATGNVDIAAADYYLTTSGSGLLATLKAALDAVGNATYTVTLDDTNDSSTGKVTIAASGGSVTAFQIVWTDTALRDTLGFTGTVSGALTYTGGNQARYLWLPNCYRSGDHPEPAAGQTYFGRPQRDTTLTLAPSGQHSAYFYNTVYRSRLRWSTLTGAKVWRAIESTTNESFERFWTDGFGKGIRFRYHPSRDDDAAYWTLIPLRPRDFPAQELDPAHFSSESIHSIEFETQDYVA